MMEDKLSRAALRLQEVELLLSQPEVYADPARLRDLTREQKELLRKLDGSLEKNNSPKGRSFFDKLF